MELAERGYQVTLIEVYRIGWRASGRNGGQIIRGPGPDLETFRNSIGQEGIHAITQMVFEANEIVKSRINKYRINCDLKMGYVDVATRPRDLEDFKSSKAFLDAQRYP